MNFDDGNRTYFIGVISNWFIFTLFYGGTGERSNFKVLKIGIKKYKKCLSNAEIVRNLIVRHRFLDI